MENSLKEKLGGFFHFVIKIMLKMGMHPVAGLFCSVVGSILSRERVSCRFDGLDWVCKWNSRYLVLSSPTWNPKGWSIANRDLFLNRYTPTEGDIIIDVGAGSGSELLFLEDCVGQAGKIYAIEPDEKAFRRLEKSVRYNQYQNVVLIKKGVSSVPGNLFLEDLSDSAIGNFVSTQETSTTYPIEITTLDLIIDEYGITEINYLKMNIEGEELRALAGFSVNHSFVKNWCISCHDFLGKESTKTFANVKEWLTQRDYNVTTYDVAPISMKAHEKFYLYA
jgi:FkbM family methyltransferase